MLPKRMSDAGLAYTRDDCRAAVQAMPENPRSVEYLQLAAACERELADRERLRTWRQVARNNGHDYLSKPLCMAGKYWRRDVRDRARTPYVVDRLRSAAWILGAYRLYDCGRWLLTLTRRRFQPFARASSNFGDLP